MAKPTRPAFRATNGAVASPHYMATLAGLRILQAGGSAVDAAIAVNSTLGVVFPHMTGIGGDAFWLIHDAQSGKVDALNASGRSVAGATREVYTARDRDRIPFRGPLAAITTPGTVDGWCRAHERYGKLPLADCLAEAISHARDGFPASDSLCSFISDYAEMLAQYPHTKREFMPGGRPPSPGEIFKLPDLANTLQAIADHGRDGFYSGAVADEMAASVAAAGGLWERSDLDHVEADWSDPISTTYRGKTVLQHGPNCQGIVHLMMLNVLEHFDIAAMGDRSADFIDVNVQACKLIFQDRDRYLSDPDFTDIPVERLLSKEYAAEMAAQIKRKEPILGTFDPVPGGTTATAVVDGDGNAVSMIQSIYHEFGSGMVAGRTGVLLQNRGSGFSLDPNHVNRLEPNKRTFHTLMPGMMLNEKGEFELAYGTMGGEGQPQTSTMMVSRYLDFKMGVQSCVDAPRWLFGRTWGEETQSLRIEETFSNEVIFELRRRGLPADILEVFSETVGHACMICRDSETGVLSAAADPRSEGIAAGW